ncbi:BTAD domain-containing putative transcriptional regulator [Nocardioides sp. TF02-7]|uniref:ATP-binding protein n=1 Tax=Nocardioides sp. TF02-7 TaxID=2917724 RepID=UPI001F06ADD1|nr:BTAD domain-containing putative transcriptional regulator [Nocardioides sp. TF02-7]UMG91989.1 AAA family ATPase [Nocardioides sp. TF02-7]
MTTAPGYALRVPEDAVDARRFEQTVTRAHKRLQPLGTWGSHGLDAAVLEQERAALDGALALWRGTPYAELDGVDAVTAERVRLEELRMVALEDRALAALALGDHAPVAAELEALTAAHPLRERLWSVRAVALARSGRQAEALDVLRRLRDVLDEELGIEPSVAVRDLQTALLRQDPDLDWRTPPAAAAPPAPPVAPPVPSAPAPRPAAEVNVAPWPMVGRDADLAALVGLLSEAERGRPSFAVLTGEPGIGKSRLAAEVLLQARRHGTRVLVGRCTQDEGAPPLWPWKSVLEGVGLDLVDAVTTAGQDEGGRFRAWERICDAVRGAARDRGLVVLLDDLHWADAATLRVLRLLVESVTDEHLLLIATWRSHPAPTGPLAEAAEALARRHAHRVALTGLPEREVRTVFEAIARRAPEAAESQALLQRTDGNPFFLVELARLSAERGGRLPGDGLPSAIGEVIDRRLARLPDETVATLRAASVIGRQFDLGTLEAAAAVADDADVLDLVEPAQAAGLLREDGPDRFRFAHALVRDRLREGLSASRLARVHARTAAALEGLPGRESEVARHWRDAGPAHAGRAWRAAVAAADVTRRMHEHDEAAGLLRSAVDSQAADPAVTPLERYDVLLRLVDAHRWSANLPGLVAAAEEAIGIAHDLADPELLARAAISASHEVLWRSAPDGETNPTVTSALRTSQDRLPPGDGELRCRVLLALAVEGKSVTPVPAIRPLVDDALAMARRLGDRRLLMNALQVGYMTQWVPSTAAERLSWITEAVRIAEETGDSRAYVVAGTLRTASLSEMGRVAEMWEQLAAARAAALRQRIFYGDLILTTIEVSWLAMCGRFAEAEAAIERLQGYGAVLVHETVEANVDLARCAVAYWGDRPGSAVDTLLRWSAEEEVRPTAAVYLCRAGRLDEARAFVADPGVEFHDDDLSTVLAAGHVAELATYLDDPTLAQRAHDVLLQHAGRPCSAGSGLVTAPVDAYLALAAAVLGRPDEAARHAASARDQATAWGLDRVCAWLEEERARLGF